MANKDSLVSIITPSYNQGEYIEDTLRSIMIQDYVNIEHIVIDGGSEDETIKILEKYENKYNLKWISEPDEGQSDAINKGFSLCNGEIVGWLNSDDCYFDAGVVSYVVEKFNEHDDVEVIYGDQVLMESDGKIIKIVKTPVWNYKRLLRFCFICQPALFFRKEVVSNNKIKNLYLSMDYEYWLRLGLKYRFLKVNKILAADRLYEGTKRESNKLEHNIESREVSEMYGGSFGLYYYIMYFLDLIYLLYRNFISIYKVLKFKKDDNYAFKSEIPSKLSLIINQTSLRNVLKFLKLEFKILFNKNN